MIVYIFGLAYIVMTIILLVLVSQYHNEKYAYRLGDIIKGYIKQNEPENFKWHSIEHPESIAAKYIKSTKEDNNLDVLTKIINEPEYIPFHNNDANSLAIHLRTGDIIDDYTEHSIQDLLEKSGLVQHAGLSYVKTKEYYKNVIKKIKEYNKNSGTKITKIIFVTGFHMPYGNRSNNRSIEYISEVLKIFNDNNFKNIDVRIGNHPDNDFVFMTTSKHFAPSGGGFSQIIRDIVIKNGGKNYE